MTNSAPKRPAWKPLLGASAEADHAWSGAQAAAAPERPSLRLASVFQWAPQLAAHLADNGAELAARCGDSGDHSRRGMGYICNVLGGWRDTRRCGPGCSDTVQRGHQGLGGTRLRQL